METPTPIGNRGGGTRRASFSGSCYAPNGEAQGDRGATKCRDLWVDHNLAAAVLDTRGLCLLVHAPTLLRPTGPTRGSVARLARGSRLSTATGATCDPGPVVWWRRAEVQPVVRDGGSAGGHCGPHCGPHGEEDLGAHRHAVASGLEPRPPSTEPIRIADRAEAERAIRHARRDDRGAAKQVHVLLAVPRPVLIRATCNAAYAARRSSVPSLTAGCSSSTGSKSPRGSSPSPTRRECRSARLCSHPCHGRLPSAQ